MSKILVTYATMAGSTGEVAQVVADVIAQSGAQVDVLPVGEVKDLTPYHAVLVGGPMIMGWHRSAIKFVSKHRSTWKSIPLGIFVLAMSLTKTGETVSGVDVYLDEKLPKPPVNADKLSFRENYTRLSKYLKPILNAAKPTKPVSIGVFGGRLEYGRLPWWAVLFAMFIIQAQAGDKRNWEAIKDWSKKLSSSLGLS